VPFRVLHSVRPRKRRRRRRPRRKPWLPIGLLLVAAAGVVFWWHTQRSERGIPPAVVEPTNVPTLVFPSPPVVTVTNLPSPPLPVERVPIPPVEIPAPPPVTVTSVPLPTVEAPPEEVPMPTETGFPRPVRDVLEAQIALARQGFSPGSIDGVMGAQTHAALRAFQRMTKRPASGELDAGTRAVLTLARPALHRYVVTSGDVARLQPLSRTWLGKSQQTALEYETLLELVAETGRASPNLIRRINPGVDWTHVGAGSTVMIPDVPPVPTPRKAGFAVITLGAKQLQVYSGDTNLMAHFPCSIAARVEKRPAGELRVVALAENPNYTFNPAIFSESAEARALGRKLILPPGPNNPVGSAWISLDRPGYGIHGTPSPEQVGRTESHGCFRLANWNAEHLLRLAWVGMPVYVEP